MFNVQQWRSLVSEVAVSPFVLPLAIMGFSCTCNPWGPYTSVVQKQPAIYKCVPSTIQPFPQPNRRVFLCMTEKYENISYRQWNREVFSGPLRSENGFGCKRFTDASDTVRYDITVVSLDLRLFKIHRCNSK